MPRPTEAPLPVLFTGFAVKGDVQALIEDPRLDQTALCRSIEFVDTMEHSGIATSGTTALQTPDDEFSG